MRKIYSILDQYGSVTQQFEGVAIVIKDDCVEIYDNGGEKKTAYLKAVWFLAPGTTICQTEEVEPVVEPKIITHKDLIAMQEAADIELMKRRANG